MTSRMEAALRLLRTEEEITAAGAEAVKGFRLSDRQCEVLAACIADATEVEESL